MKINLDKVKVNRTFSLKLITAEKLKSYAGKNKVEMSELVDQLINTFVDGQEKK